MMNFHEEDAYINKRAAAKYVALVNCVTVIFLAVFIAVGNLNKIPGVLVV